MSGVGAIGEGIRRTPRSKTMYRLVREDRSVQWTDDMSVRLARGETTRALVEYLRTAETQGTTRSEMLTVLTERFALSFDDARLAMDRTVGGFVRAASGNPANEPDRGKDPVAWTAYQIALGRLFEEPDTGPTQEQMVTAQELLDGARRAERTKETTDVAVALEVTRLAVSSTEPGRVRYHLLLEAATCISVAAEALISEQGEGRCAREGSQQWVDGVMLASAARSITEKYAAQPDPALEDRGYELAGRIVTQLLGQCHAFVGRAMLDSARCAQRNGDSEKAIRFAQAVIADFTVLLDWFAQEKPVDEDALAISCLREAISLVMETQGTTPELDALLSRTDAVLSRAQTD